MVIPVSHPQLNVPPRLVIGNEVIGVLSVSPIQHDHDTLASLLGRDQWRIHNALSLQSASTFLRSHAVPLVVCGYDLSPDRWTQLLDEIRLLSIPPLLIMTCRVADDSLWAEALNVGAYDVLAKPLDRTEVTRILSSAWLHWQQQYCVFPQTGSLVPTAAVGVGPSFPEVFALYTRRKSWLGIHGRNAVSQGEMFGCSRQLVEEGQTYEENLYRQPQCLGNGRHAPSAL